MSFYREIKEKIVNDIDKIIKEKEDLVHLKKRKIWENEKRLQRGENRVKSGEHEYGLSIKQEIAELTSKKDESDLQIGNLNDQIGDFKAQIKNIERVKDDLEYAKLEKEKELHLIADMNLRRKCALTKLIDEKVVLQIEMEQLLANNDASIRAMALRISTFNDNNDENDDADDNTCAICLEKYNRKDHFRSCVILCGHQFGKQCLQKLNYGRCPTCNKNFQKHCHILQLY